MDALLRHRLLLTLCVAATWPALDPFFAGFLAADRMPGFLLFSSHLGAGKAMLLFAAMLLPVTLLSLIVAVSGTVLSGVLALGVSMLLFAARFGGAEALVRRGNLPGDYRALLIESVALAALLACAGAAVALLTPRAKAKLPWLTHYPGHVAGLERRTPGATLAGLVLTAVVAAPLVHVLCVGGGAKQSIGGVVIAFAVGAVASHYAIGARATLGTLLAPLLLPVLAYGLPLASGSGDYAMTSRWFTGDLPNLCKVLPIYYLTAGPVGAVLGYALSHPHEAHQAATA